MFGWLKRHLIPHQNNDYKPHLLEGVAMSGLLCLVLLSFTVANVQALLWVSSEWMISTILPAVIVSETNGERTDEDLAPLVRNDVLDKAAQLKAEHMAHEKYFAHYSPDGVSPWYWFGQVSYDYLHAGENLAVHFTDSADVVEAWMDSPTHRANIMNGQYSEIGIGTAKGEFEGYETVFVVQLFGTPREQIVSTQLAVSTNQPSTESVDTEEVPIVTDSGTILSAEDEEIASSSSEEAVTPPATRPYEPLPEPEPITTPQEETLPAETDVQTASSTPVASTTPVYPNEATSTPLAEPTYVVLNHLSTSTTGTAATVSGEGNSTPPTFALATQPHKLLQYLYIGIGTLVTLVLILSVFIEVRRQHPLHVAYSTGMMALMVLLMYVHLALSKGVLIA